MKEVIKMFLLENTYVIGDIHGSFKPIRDFYNRNKDKINFDRDTHLIILLGDAGLNYFLNERDDQLKRKLSEYPFTYFVVRGNHEERPSVCMEASPSDWEFDICLGGAVRIEKKYPYIKYADDGAALYRIPYIKTPAYLRDDNEETGDIEWNDEIDYLRVLTLPGAFSIDKEYRQLMGYSWFPGEQMTSEEMNYAKQLVAEVKHCDIVLSHTCPCCYEPTDLFLPFVDQSKVDKSMEQLLGAIEFVLDYDLWMWGHYHAYRDYPRNDGRGKRIMLFQEVVSLYQVVNEDTVEVL